ncbi:hypothetical protein Btru_069395 [Bulinus truncatus]|nr:hypothetical protein Btru_069395 [Bulinus truncatus]
MRYPINNDVICSASARLAVTHEKKKIALLSLARTTARVSSLMRTRQAFEILTATETFTAIYGGHISGRRLRGVKVNPIFEENDVTRLGEGGDTQSECGVPVGEIQIEMYESLPRHATIRHCRSAPIASNGQAKGGGGGEVPPSRQALNRGVTRRDSDKENSSQGATGAGSQKRQLTRQKRYELSAPDDPDAIEPAETPVSTPTNSSPTSSLYSKSKNNEVPSRPISSRPFVEKHHLSTVSERTNSVDSSEGPTLIYDEWNALTSQVHDPNQAHTRETAGRPSVTSLDLMNNNEMSMPDRMLQHYGNNESVHMRRSHVDELGNDVYLEELSRIPSSLRPEDVIFCDTLGLRALFSLSNSSSADSDYKAFETKLSGRMKCACNGRPTLKCECGRAALQKLFRENRSGGDIGSLDDNAQVLDAARLLKHRLYSGDNPLTKGPALRSKLLALHALGQAEGKFVTFSEDTIFNEDNRVTYVKECITRSAFHLPSDDPEAGCDNAGYDGFLTDDEKVLQRTGVEKGTSSQGLHQGSVVLSVSSLNAPAFLHAYLMGFHQDKGVETNLVVGNEIRAAPVSIEAIGGITSDDPAFDMIGEASEEDFEKSAAEKKKEKKDLLRKVH